MDGQASTDGGEEAARARALLASCRVALLDMNSTFMFGEDRLGPGEDFAATYRSLGGQALAGGMVIDAVHACVAHMGRLYDDPARVEDFPSVLEVLSELPSSAMLPEAERHRLGQVIARHELGQMPDAHADAVRALSRTHRLGLVANIWSLKEPWVAELARAGLADVFAARVFSSDSRSMKPAPTLFVEALNGCGVEEPGPHRDVVFIGDNLRCDIGGAQAVGLRTIWINPAGKAPPADGPKPDTWVSDLCDLVHAARSDGAGL